MLPLTLDDVSCRTYQRRLTSEAVDSADSSIGIAQA